MPRISAGSIEEHRAETADRLLDAWGELLKANGYDRVSLSDVASRVKLARTAIYNYFPDREALLLAWTEREVRRSVEQMNERIAGAPTATEKLQTAVRLQLATFPTDHLPPGQEVVHFLGEETYRRFMAHIEPLEHAVRDILTEGVERGEFREVDPAATVPLVLACIGCQRVPLTTGAHDLHTATRVVCDFVLHGLAPAAAPRQRRKPTSTGGSQKSLVSRNSHQSS